MTMKPEDVLTITGPIRSQKTGVVLPRPGIFVAPAPVAVSNPFPNRRAYPLTNTNYRWLKLAARLTLSQAF
jgi:hypothetical protein